MKTRGIEDLTARSTVASCRYRKSVHTAGVCNTPSATMGQRVTGKAPLMLVEAPDRSEFGYSVRVPRYGERSTVDDG